VGRVLLGIVMLRVIGAMVIRSAILRFRKY